MSNYPKNPNHDQAVDLLARALSASGESGAWRSVRKSEWIAAADTLITEINERLCQAHEDGYLEAKADTNLAFDEGYESGWEECENEFHRAAQHGIFPSRDCEDCPDENGPYEDEYEVADPSEWILGFLIGGFPVGTRADYVRLQ